MSQFAPLRVGGWAFGEVLTSTQMNQLNTDFPFALNGRDGGSYSPSGTLSLQTPTTKQLVFNGVTFNSAADGGGAGIVGPISSDNNADFGGACTAVSFTSTIPVGGFVGNAVTVVNVNCSQVICSGNVSGLTFSCTGASGFSGAMTFGGSGRVVPRTIIQAATAGMTAAVSTASDYVYTSAAASSVLSCSHTGVTAGDRFDVTNFDTTNSVAVKDGATTLVTLRNSTGLNYSATVLFNGTAFIVTRLWVAA